MAGGSAGAVDTEDGESMSTRTPFIEWPANEPLPKCGTVIHANKLGIAVVAETKENHRVFGPDEYRKSVRVEFYQRVELEAPKRPAKKKRRKKQ